MRWLLLVGVCIKALMIPGYYSTDFDVHRNWLAITHTLPIAQWYTEATSEWTLDYPPLFAWFEWLLSCPAAAVDAQMLEISAEPYSNPVVVLFQRGTVIAADTLLCFALWRYFEGGSSSEKQLTFRGSMACALLFLHPALLLVDHIHFQYNGFLFGVMVLSLWCHANGSHLAGGALFAVLINMKHMFVVAGPAYFIFILLHHCAGVSGESGGQHFGAALSQNSFWTRLVKMGGTVVAICGISLGPFVLCGAVPALLSRLFPVGRGLCHAYWAANVWAVANVVDKVACKLTPGCDSTTAQLTSGLVGSEEHQQFAMLPAVGPSVCLLLSVAGMIPALCSLAARPSFNRFLQTIVVSTLSAFMFGYHVHEKHILSSLIPLGLLIRCGKAHAALFFNLSVVSCVSLFPLLFKAQEYPLNWLTIMAYHPVLYCVLSNFYCRPSENKPLLKIWERLYLFGALPLLELFCAVIHLLFLQEKLQFLPLLLRSIVCFVGVFYCWVSGYVTLLSH